MELGDVHLSQRQMPDVVDYRSTATYDSLRSVPTVPPSTYSRSLTSNVPINPLSTYSGSLIGNASHIQPGRDESNGSNPYLKVTNMQYRQTPEYCCTRKTVAIVVAFVLMFACIVGLVAAVVVLHSTKGTSTVTHVTEPRSGIRTTDKPATTINSTTQDDTTTSSAASSKNTLASPTDSTTIESCSGTRKCHSCSSSNIRCPADGNMAGSDPGEVMNCPCGTACFSEIRPWNGVQRGCTKEFPLWDERSRTNMTCQQIQDSFLCFCLGDRCNTHNMTVYPQYEGN